MQAATQLPLAQRVASVGFVRATVFEAFVSAALQLLVAPFLADYLFERGQVFAVHFLALESAPASHRRLQRARGTKPFVTRARTFMDGSFRTARQNFITDLIARRNRIQARRPFLAGYGGQRRLSARARGYSIRAQRAAVASVLVTDGGASVIFAIQLLVANGTAAEM